MTRDYITGAPFAIERCQACALVRTRPVAAVLEPATHYPAAYYGTSGRFLGVIESALERLHAIRASRLTRAVGDGPGRVLDVGCGHGTLLAALRRRGWDVVGTELSDAGAAYARTALGLPVLVGDLTDLHLPSSTFDAIVLWHVFEHMIDPAAAVREVRRLLRPGGCLLISVPNFGSPESRWSRGGWFHLDAPRHLHHFTVGTLQTLLADAGFTIKHTSYSTPEYDFFSAVQSAENRLGLTPNLLYSLLRARSARLSPPRTVPAWQRAVAVGLAPVLSAVAAVWVPAATLARQGATITFYAIRQGS